MATGSRRHELPHSLWLDRLPAANHDLIAGWFDRDIRLRAQDLHQGFRRIGIEGCREASRAGIVVGDANPRAAVVKALSGLMAIRSYEAAPAVVEAATRRIDSRDIDHDGRVKLHYGLGKHYDRDAQFDRAFEHFAAANAILRRRNAPFDRKRVSDAVDRTIDFFSASYFARLAGAGGSSCEQPVFIVGMPRSGSTLTEHILASHPDVFGAGELQELPAS